MTEYESSSALDIDDRPSAQFYGFLAIVFAALIVSVLLAALLVVKLRATPQPASSAVAAAPAPAPAPGVAAPAVASSITWESSYESAMETARQTGKPVMIDFYTDWCGVCKWMDANTMPAPEVIAASQNFVNVRINAEHRTDVAQQYGVNGYPTYVFLDSNGNVRNSFAGGKSPAEFAQLMQSSR